MRSRLLPIVCAVFLVIAMTVQFFVSYSREKADLMQQMEYKMELAQKDFIFEMYDMHEATDEITHYFPEFDDNKDKIEFIKEISKTDFRLCIVAISPSFPSVLQSRGNGVARLLFG